MLIKTEGIVIYKVKYSETSLVAHLLTKEMGVKAFMIKGLRSKNSKTSVALFDYMNVLDVIASQRNASELLTIREVGFSENSSFQSLDVYKNSILLFIAEFIHKILTNPGTDAALYQFVSHAVSYFVHSERQIPDFHLWFITRFAAFLGINPIDNYEPKCSIFSIQQARFIPISMPVEGTFTESSSRILHRYLNLSAEHCGKNMESLNLRNQYLDEMLFYYRFHLEHFSGLKSHEILKSVFR
jgi:DNA repair protein RecO (recombination protein O)